MIMIALEAAISAVIALTVLELLAVQEFNGMGDAIVILDPRINPSSSRVEAVKTMTPHRSNHG
jgi:hypothetical protein